MTQISRFIGRVVPVAQRVTGDEGESAAPEGGGGFADYALASLHRLRIYPDTEGVIELFSHRDDRTSRIVSAFVVGDCDDETKTQGEKHLRSPEAAVLY